MRPPVWLHVLSAMAVLYACHDAGADCTSNAQCKDGRVCQSGVCAYATGAGADPANSLTCSKDRDCPGSEVCEQGTCRSEGDNTVTSPGVSTPTAEPPPPAPVPEQAKPWTLGGDVSVSLLSLSASSSGNDSDAVEGYELRATLGTRDAHRYGGLGISYVAPSSGNGGVLTAILYVYDLYDLGFYSLALGFGSPTTGPSSLVAITEAEVGIHSGKLRLGFELGLIDSGFEESTLLIGASLGAGF